MTLLPEFRLVSYLSRWEHAVRYPLSSSYPESLSLDALLDIAGPATRNAYGRLAFDYAPIRGEPDLRAAIASTFETVSAEDVMVFAGADEAILAAMQAILTPGDHAVVATPCYGSLEAIPASICAVSGVPLDPDRGWVLDPTQVRDTLRPNTRLLVVNAPHNPTGTVPDRATFDALVELCRQRGLWFLSDEVYRLTEHDPAARLPAAADRYERALSINVMSKSFGLPGLRVGWVACRDPALVARLERARQYITIAGSPHNELLAGVALRHAKALLDRNAAIARGNLDALRDVLGRRPDLFAWAEPQAGVLAFPRYLGREGADAFAARLVEDTGILLVPSSVYRSALAPVPDDYLRIGFGRACAAAAMPVLADWLERY